MKGIRLVTLAATGLFVLMSSVAHAAGGGHGGGMGGMGEPAAMQAACRRAI